MLQFQHKPQSKRGLYMAFFLLTSLMLSPMLWSCNKDNVNKYQFVNTKDTVMQVSSNKVLYIILTGARGNSIETSNTPNLNRIKDHANYSFQSVSDDNGLDATTWADMLTGVNKTHHNILSNDFAGNRLSTYPMFFKFIKQKTAMRTASFVASNALSTNLVSDANLNEKYSDDDAAVKNAVITELKREDAGVVLAEFNGIKRAGDQFGYDSSIPEYQQAILSADTYVGELINELGKRPNYANENWLVIIASNRGGIHPVPPAENDGTLFSRPALNNYILFYSPKFAPQLYEKPNTSALPYEGAAVNFTGTTTRATLSSANADVFNFGSGISASDYTVEFKLRVNTFGTLNADIFSKSTSPANSSKGWWIIHSGSAGVWRLGGLYSSVITSANAPRLTTGAWYSIGFKIYRESGKRWVVLYQDGEPISNPADITTRDVDNTAPLIAGHIGGYGNTANQNITDIRLFKAALPDNVIKEYACQFDVPSTHPNYADLIGYWSGTDGSGTLLKDRISGTHNFSIGGSPTWTAFQDTDPKFCIPFSTAIYNELPRGVDIPKYILSWLKLSTTSLTLDGKTWLPKYNAVNP